MLTYVQKRLILSTRFLQSDFRMEKIALMPGDRNKKEQKLRILYLHKFVRFFLNSLYTAHCHSSAHGNSGLSA